MTSIADARARLRLSLERAAYDRLSWLPDAIGDITHNYADNASGMMFPSIYDPYADARKGNLPSYGPGTVERLVGDYLDLPYRHTLLDKWLLRLLVETEFFAFASSQLTPGAFNPQPLRRLGALSAFGLNVVANAVLVAVVWLILWAANEWTPVGGGWTGWAAAVAGGWFVLAFFLNLISLPRDWHRLVKARRAATDLLEAQRDAWQSLLSDGPISVRRVSETVQAAADKGTVWPSATFALLDDVAARTARL